MIEFIGIALTVAIALSLAGAVIVGAISGLAILCIELFENEFTASVAFLLSVCLLIGIVVATGQMIMS